MQVRIDRQAVRFTFEDQGNGFDTSLFGRPVEPDEIDRIGGRGLVLIRTFMDQVSFNSQGNRIAMVKARPNRV